MTLFKRDDCWWNDDDVRECNSSWDSWGKWVALVMFIAFLAILAFAVYYVSRRRTAVGRRPLPGTAWAVPAPRKDNNSHQLQPQTYAYQTSNPPNSYYPPGDVETGVHNRDDDHDMPPPQYGAASDYQVTAPAQPKAVHDADAPPYSPPSGPPPGHS